MAAFNKLGSLLRHSALKNGASTVPVPAMHLLNATRHMSTRLFVGGISWGTDEQSLKDAFSSFGDVIDARIILDRETGRSRGFGFVNFSNDEDAKSAMSSMDGQDLHGRTIRVNIATDRPTGNRGYGGDQGYSGGGYGGGNSYGAGGQDAF